MFSVKLKHILRSGILLSLFAVIGTLIVAYVYEHTLDPIAESERQALLRHLHNVLPPQSHDNELFTDVIFLADAKLLGTKNSVPIYRARLDNQPIAALITAYAREGYGGKIKLLVAVRVDGTLSGVRVLNHRETPGLGDAIDIRRSDWILGFNNRSLHNPDEQGWRVKRDGGEFDQFTGATITPRAIVKAIHLILVYFKKNKDLIFSTHPKPRPDKDE